jgi:hypothetical protein
LFASLPNSTQPLPQREKPSAVSQVNVHDLPLQVGMAPAGVLHVAQTPSQLRVPPGHWQAPLAQVASVGHTTPQAPQLLLSFEGFVSQPSLAVLLQSRNGLVHETTAQFELVQVDVAFARLQTFPHAPQFFGSFVRLISQPSATVSLQSMKPVLHDVSAHFELTQLAEAFAKLQAALHAPQLLMSFVVFVSQPAAAVQSAKPVLQAPIAHLELAHDAAALAKAQPVPHAPQFFGSLVRLISQPSVGLLSQSAKPAVHAAIAHFEVLHAGVAFAGAHAVLQAPQLATSLVVLTSHPLAGFPSQSANPVLQPLTAHAELAQSGVAFASEQAAPQALQSFTLLVVSTQLVPPQSVGVPAGQPETQPEAEHTGVAAAHAVGFAAVLQPPQLAGWVMSVSQPLLARPSQSANPAAHADTMQPEALHADVACGRLHVAPQAPQLFGSLVVLTSHPVDASLSQSAKPALHEDTAQLDAAQIPFACAGLHGMPHPPQLAMSLVVSTSHPVDAFPSQSEKPDAHAATTQADPVQPPVA